MVIGTTGRHLLYVGCYTPSGDLGIRVLDASRDDGVLVPVGEHAGVADASYLAAHPSGRLLYAVSERTEPGSGEVVALRIDPDDGHLEEVDRASTRGAAPCHVAVTEDGRRLYVANYLDGSVVAFALGDDGRIASLLSHHRHTGSGPRGDRQEGPHTHGVLPRRRDSVLVTDLGTDQLLRYRHVADDNGALRLDDVLAMPPGTGPRHAVAHPTSPDHVLVVGELDQSVTVVVDRPDQPLRIVGSGRTVEEDVDRRTTTSAALVVHPRGHLAYVSDRGVDTVTVLTLPGRDGDPVRRRTTPAGGRTPRDLLLLPTGRHLAVAAQDSDEVVVLVLDDDGTPGAVVDRQPVVAPAGLLCVSWRD